MTEATRVAVLNFVHATVTFLPNDTTLSRSSRSLGTVRLEALPYRNVDISKFYPYGNVTFPECRSRPC
jgi:hypothetical protein